MKKMTAMLLAAVMTLSLFAGCGGAKPADREDFTIVTTIYPIYDWLCRLTGDAQNVKVTLLLDDGKDIHNYQPTAKDMVTIKDSDYFVFVGGESDQWVSDAAANFFPADDGSKRAVSLMETLGSAVKEEEIVEGMQAEEEDGALDEHVWLSLKNARLFCRELAADLEEMDAANAAVYRENEEAYGKQLDALDQAYTKALTADEKKYDTLLFADRFPFRYLTDDYGLSYYAAFSGCSADSEVSVETVAFLANKLNELALPAVMTIDGSDGKIAKTVIATSGREDTAILVLDSMQAHTKDSGDYLETMEKNLDTLKTALAVG